MDIPPVIEVVPYNHEWPKFYEEEAEKIKGALKGHCVTVHHIGSTAVPGLAAKPVIDILIVVKNLLALDAEVAKLEKLGYVPKGEYGIAFRRYFQKGTMRRTHNVHVFEEGSPEIERHLHFRDYLRKNPQACKEYELLKMTLAEQHPGNMQAYTNGKDLFIQNIDKKSGLSALRLVTACTNREWEAVNQLRARYFLQQGLAGELNKEHLCKMTTDNDRLTSLSEHLCEMTTDNGRLTSLSVHLVLLKGVDIIGYAEISLPSSNQAELCLLIMQTGFEAYQAQFMALLERWLSHQSRSFKKS